MPYESDHAMPSATDTAGGGSPTQEAGVGSSSGPGVVLDRGGVLRPYVNDRLNSRIPVSLPDGRWEVQSQIELADGLRPAFLLHSPAYSLVQGIDLWQLFDREGGSVAVQRLAASDVVLDPGQGLLYHAALNGTLSAYQLRDGQPAFTLGLLFGSEFERVFFARRGHRMVVASVEQRVDPHEPEAPEYALVEVQDLGDPIQADDIKILTSARLLTSLQRSATVLQAAMHQDTLVIATPGKVEMADLDLTILATYEGAFTPLAMSLDETGRIYLVVQIEENEQARRYALWVLSSAGQRLVEVDLPAQDRYTPPIVGYDHHIYLPLGDSIQAISPEGENLWKKYGGGPIAGAVATADHRVLVAGGGWLSAFDAAGERTMVFMHDEGPWVTPPVLTEHGDILVATEQHLYRLTRKR